jgi:hypothetical protein
LLAKWGQGQACELEVLTAERDTDDGDAQQKAERKVGKANPDAAQYNPKDVHDKAQSSARLGCGLHALAERAEGKKTYLQGLDTERNADDGDHHAYTGHDVFHSGHYTAQHQPENVHQ